MATCAVHVWTMEVGALDEAGATQWLPMLDGDERRRAANFVFPRHRVQFIAAHALTRAALGRLCARPPDAFRLSAEASGKPAAWLDAAPAPLSFNLSHTDGMVGVAAAYGAGWSIGFDLEPLARRFDPRIVERVLSPGEVAWLDTLAEPRRTEGLLRLWTLKEAFVKATGASLTQDLPAFIIDALSRIHLAPQSPERGPGPDLARGGRPA